MRLRALAIALVVGAALPASAAPDRTDVARGKFQGKKHAILVDAGTERAKLGTWCRDAGLVAQATATFLRAVEESEGTNAWAQRIVGIMRASNDKFWTTVNRHPSKAYLDTFEKKSRKLDEDREDALFRLAKEGHKDGLDTEPYEVWAGLVRASDAPLTLDAQGRVVLRAGTLPEDVSEKMKKAALDVNGRTYLRDAFLELVPLVKEIREAVGERVRVRMQGKAKPPDDMLATLEALLPFLEDDLGGRPTERMTVFVFQDRATFRTWLDAAKLSAFAMASGLADGATRTAIVCAEGCDSEALRGMCMHEMSHLFMYGVTPVVMPSWYAEGFAETYGGEGTFTWKDAKLTAGGLMVESELAPLRKDDGFIPLADLTAGDALAILSKDKTKGRRFYAESWAFLRFMRTAAPPDLAARFRLWETACRGAAFGAQAGKPREQDVEPASSDFRRRFGNDLAGLEKLFRVWLASPK